MLLIVMQQQPNPSESFSCHTQMTAVKPLQLMFGHPFSAEHVKIVTSACMPAKGDICNLNSQSIMLQILIRGGNVYSAHPASLLTVNSFTMRCRRLVKDPRLKEETRLVGFRQTSISHDMPHPRGLIRAGVWGPQSDMHMRL